MVKRLGFGLIEVLVALVLLSIGLLGVAGSTLLAARVMREAEATERAAFEVLQVLDSLSRVRAPSAGQRQVGPLHISWQLHRTEAGLQLIDLAVAYSDGGTIRTATYRVAHLEP